MRVLILGNARSSHIVKWVNSLVEKGLEVHLAFCKDHTPQTNMIKENVNLHQLYFSSPIGYYLNAYSLNKIIKLLKPCVINAHYASGYGTLMSYCRYTPKVLSVWGSDIYEFPYRNKFSMNRVIKNISSAYALSSTSNNMVNQIYSLTDKCPNLIKVIPFGIDMDLFKRKTPYGDSKEINIGIAKSLKENYGIKYIIEAIKLIETKEQLGEIRICLNIYGDGPIKTELQDLISKLNLGDTVHLHGHIDNTKLPEILEKTDIYVLFSNRESFGVSALEAMAMELPIIASDAVGFKEVLKDGLYGVIVPKTNVEELAKQIIRLILDYKFRKELGKKAMLHVREEYNWNDNVESMIEFYKEVIKLAADKR